MFHKILILLFVYIPAITYAGHVDIKLENLSHSELADINFDGNLAAHQNEVMRVLTGYFESVEIGFDLKIIQTYTTEGAPTYEIHSKPALTEGMMAEIHQNLQIIPAIHTLNGTFYALYTIQLNGGNHDRALTYEPLFKTPIQRQQANFYQLNDAEQKLALQTWITSVALPILSRKLNTIDSTFHYLSSTDYTILTAGRIASLTVASEVYWDGFLAEPSTGDTHNLLPLITAHFYALNGQLEYASLYLQILYNFTDPTLLAYKFIEELSWRIQYLLARENEKIEAGKIYFKAKSYEIAAEHFERAYAQNENSVAAIYYLLITKNQLNGDTLSAPKGPKYLSEYYPEFSESFSPDTKKEYYIAVRKQERSDFFIDPLSYDEDFKKLADIALEVGDYGFAATLFQFLTLQPKSDFSAKEAKYYRNYSLSKLNYNLDEGEQYTKIKRYYKKRMKKHPAYKKFKP